MNQAVKPLPTPVPAPIREPGRAVAMGRQVLEIEEQKTLIDQKRLLKQQQVHGWVAGGWSSSTGWSSGCSPRLVIRLLNRMPISNSIHIGTASRVWEKMSGGVRIMPTTKQPMIT